MTQCPDLAFLDASETSVTLQIVGGIARTWAHSLISLALPNAAARRIRELYHTGGEALNFVKKSNKQTLEVNVITSKPISKISQNGEGLFEIS